MASRKRAKSRRLDKKQQHHGKDFAYAAGFIAILALILAFAVELPSRAPSYTNTANQQPATPTTAPDSSLLDAAMSYVQQTYITSSGVAGDIIYSNFQYSTALTSDNAARVTVSFDRITKYPSYTLTQQMQQVLGLEIRSDDWIVNDSPPAMVLATTRT